MAMFDRLMTMPVTVPYARSNGLVMLVLMMNVVRMLVLVFERLVDVLMLVPLGEMQPYARPDQQSSDNQGDGHALS